MFCFVSFILLGDSPASPDLFEPAQQRRRLIVIPDTDDETQDVPLQNGQDLLAYENFDAQPTPPRNVSPVQVDYFVRVESEMKQRWDDEYIEQMLSPGYMRVLRNMFEEIDDWLENNGGVEPFPQNFERFMRHNWCLRKLSRMERIRINKLRLKYDMISEEKDARAETVFWGQVDRNEPNARRLIPGCSICQHDLRNESFTVQKLRCGHMFHTRCIERHLDDNDNPRCPNCNVYTNNIGERVHFSYQQ